MSIFDYFEGFPHLVGDILRHLDAKSLSSCEQTCKHFKRWIAECKSWRKHFISLIGEVEMDRYACWKGRLEEDCNLYNIKLYWLSIYQFKKELDRNWLTGNHTTLQMRETTLIRLFAVTTTVVVTAGESSPNSWVIKFWNRINFNCQKEVVVGGCEVTGMACDDQQLVLSTLNNLHMAVFLVLDMKTGEIMNRIDEKDPIQGYNHFKSNWKLCIGSGLLTIHRILIKNDDNRQLISRLDVHDGWNGMDWRKSRWRMDSVNQRHLVYPMLIGHDGRYVAIHRHDPPRFELINSGMESVRTIDSLDNCTDVQYGGGVLIAASAQMGTHTRTSCVIRVWDVETGCCLREFKEIESTRYHNMNHLVGFSKNYLLSIPDLGSNESRRVIKIRHLNSDSTAPISTLSVDWRTSSRDRFFVDDFQLIYHYNHPDDTSVLHILNFAPEI